MTNAEPPYGPAATAPSVSPASAETPWTQPPTSATPRRGLGITSLVFGLVPVVVVPLSIVAVIALAQGDGGGWALLGYGIFFAFIDLVLAVVCGIVALVCGIVAIRRRRGRGPGIVGTVLGSIALGLVLITVVNWVSGAYLGS